MAPSTDQEGPSVPLHQRTRHSSCEQRRQGTGQLKSQTSAPPPQSPVLGDLRRRGVIGLLGEA